MKKTITSMLLLLAALIGLNANAAIYIVGDAPFGGWNPGAGVEMTPQGDGTYTDTTTINGSVYFVFADGLDSDWTTFNSNYRIGPTNGNQTVTPGTWLATQKVNADNGAYLFQGTGNNYAIIFDEINHMFKIDGYVDPLPPVETYTVVGPEHVFGSNWNVTDETNDMVLDAETGLYTWTKDNVELTADFGFKVVGNHNWDNEWPQGYDNNWMVNVPEEGIYTIKITFNHEAEDAYRITCTLTKTGDIDPVEHTYIVAGTENLFGSNWDHTDNNNLMTQGENGIFTWIKEGVEFDDGESFEFKVVQDHNWNFAWPTSNYFYRCNKAGTYTILITFNEDTKEINMTATLTGDQPEPPEPVIDDVYIIGDVNNFAWSPFKGVQMTYNQGIYTAEITTQRQSDLNFAYFGFTKKLADAGSEEPWNDIAPYRFGPVSEGYFLMTEDLLGEDINLATDGSYESIAIGEGSWIVTVDLIHNTFSISKGDAPDPEPLFGDINGDGAVNISDINLLINSILSDDENMDYDINGDGSVNISDVTLLIDCILSDHTPTTRTPLVNMERKDAELWCNITGEGDIYIDDENYGPAPVDYLVATQTDEYQTGSFIVYAIARGKEMSEILDVDWELEAEETPQQVTSTPTAEIVRTGAELWCNITGEGDIYIDGEYIGPAPISILIATQSNEYQEGSLFIHAIAPDMAPSETIRVQWALEAKPVEGFGFADMLNTADNTQVAFTRNAIVLWQRRYYLFAMDDTGFGLIYGDTGQTYNQGDVIPAGFGGNKMLYMGEPEIQNPTGFQPAVDNVNVSPLVISLEDIGHPLWSHYVVVKNVTIGDQEESSGVRTITDANGLTGAIYSGTFFVDLPEDLSKSYDIYGIINCYKSTYQILPTRFEPAQ